MMSAGLIILFASCSKSSDSPAPPQPPPPVLKLTISNLQYEPQKIPVKLYEPNFTVTGTINYTNAQDGLAKIRITSVSPGFDLTVTVQGATQTSGTVTGFFEFTRPDDALDLPFEIWAIDGKGNVSNKLSGTLRVIIDESATSWWTVAINAPSIMNDIGWFDNKYIAVGNAGAVLLSEMGNTWSLQPTGMNNRLTAIAGSVSRYVAVGDNGSILSSPDGINWSIHAAEPTNTTPLTDVVSFDTAFVAVGSNHADRSAVIMNSPDGIHWTRNAYSSVNGQLNAIASSGSLLVAIGMTDGRLVALSSTDGMFWKETPLPDTTINLAYDIIWAQNQFLVTGFGFIARSPDGINWTVTNMPASLLINRLTHTGNIYAGAGNGIYTSPDGLNWNRTYTGDPNYPFRSIAWSGTNYVATGLLYNMAVSP